MSEIDTDVTVAEEAPTTAEGSIKLVPQAEQLKNPDVAVMFALARSDLPLLSEYCTSLAGATAGDKSRFVAQWWEISAESLGQAWELYQCSPVNRTAFGGRELAVFWQNESGEMAALAASVADLNHVAQNWLRGKPNWKKPGVVVGIMAELPSAIYGGEIYDCNCSAVVPNDPAIMPALACYFQSGDYAKELRKINQALAVSSTLTLVKVPFDLAHWQKVAAEKYPNGLPEPQSDDPTQWLFHGHPAGRVPLTTDPAVHAGTILQVAVARLAGYRWPAELDPQMRLAPEARAWVEKCKELDSHADDDGVIPLVPMRGEPAAEGRVRDLLRAACGAEWSSAKEATLLAAAAAANGEKSASATLDDWLKNRFFAEHCSLFHNRPFVWHIWDGRKKDGFGVLVHYHRLAAPNGEGRRLLEKITHGYLGDWIARQRDEVRGSKDGADARLAAAVDLQRKLEAILQGDPPYDIFVRWKPLHKQAIGWEPDLNDGVRMNIRPFVEAGVLRDRVNVKYTVDRGHEPKAIRPKADFPWFWEGATFTGDRVNDVHLTAPEKQAARDAKAGET